MVFYMVPFAGGGWRNHQIFYAKNAVRVPPDGERALRAQPISLLYGSFFSTGVRGSQLVSFYYITYVSQKNIGVETFSAPFNWLNIHSASI